LAKKEKKYFFSFFANSILNELLNKHFENIEEYVKNKN
jgi:hypothetical protein